jgi:hypothetical protein
MGFKRLFLVFTDSVFLSHVSAKLLSVGPRLERLMVDEVRKPDVAIYTSARAWSDRSIEPTDVLSRHERPSAIDAQGAG